jgi:hypothetical protein
MKFTKSRYTNNGEGVVTEFTAKKNFAGRLFYYILVIQRR